MSQGNPYQPPLSQVADVEGSTEWGKFIDGGRPVEAGQGWAWLASGFDLFRRRPVTWLGMTVIFGLIFVGGSLLPFVGVLISLLFPVFLAGMLIGCRDLERDGNFGVGHLFAAFGGTTGRLVLLSVFNIVAWIVLAMPLVLMMGTSLAGLTSGDPAAIMAAGPAFVVGVLVAVALSVPIYMALWFAPCLVVFNDLGPVQALSQSFRACLKNMMPFLLYGVLLIILLMLAAIPFGLGFLVAVPMTVASIYAGYRDIFYTSA
jgi:hypothetical protein